MTSDFTIDFSRYTDFVNLPSEMITLAFGTYRISYEPPEGALESDVNMSISSEANLDQMLEFFKSFLMATGYPIRFEDTLRFGEQPHQDDSFSFLHLNTEKESFPPFLGTAGCDHISYGNL